jgi:hypothetical protein
MEYYVGKYTYFYIHYWNIIYNYFTNSLVFVAVCNLWEKDKLNDLINETKKTNSQLEKLRALFVTMIKLQKDSKSLTKKSESED